MHTLNSPKVYPRLDNVYKTKASLNFDMMRAKIYDTAESRNHG